MKTCPQCQCPALDDAAECILCGASLAASTTPETRSQVGEPPLSSIAPIPSAPSAVQDLSLQTAMPSPLSTSPTSTLNQAAMSPSPSASSPPLVPPASVLAPVSSPSTSQPMPSAPVSRTVPSAPAPQPVYSGGTDEFVAVPSTVSIANLHTITSPIAPTEPSPQKSGTADFVAVPTTAVLSPEQKSGTADFIAVPTNIALPTQSPLDMPKVAQPPPPPTEAIKAAQPPPPPTEAIKAAQPPPPPTEAIKAAQPPPPPTEAIKAAQPPPPPTEAIKAAQLPPPPTEAIKAAQLPPPSQVRSGGISDAQEAVVPAMPVSAMPVSAMPVSAMPVSASLASSSLSSEAAGPVLTADSVVGRSGLPLKEIAPPMRDFSAMETGKAEPWASEGDAAWEQGASSKPSRLPLILGGASVLLIVGALWSGLFSKTTPQPPPKQRTQAKTDEAPRTRRIGENPSARALAALSPDAKGQASDAKPPMADAKPRSPEAKDSSSQRVEPAPERREEEVPQERQPTASPNGDDPTRTKVSPTPKIRRPRPVRRTRPARRAVVRKASVRSGGCPSVAGMRAIRLQSVGMPLHKVMIRVQASVVSPDAKGCIQIPVSTNVLMLAYKPDVTAYHLCQMKLSSRTTIRFALVDANIAPPADGGCSK